MYLIHLFLHGIIISMICFHARECVKMDRTYDWGGWVSHDKLTKCSPKAIDKSLWEIGSHLEFEGGLQNWRNIFGTFRLIFVLKSVGR